MSHVFLSQWKTVIAVIILFGLGGWYASAIISNSYDVYRLSHQGITTIGYIVETWEDYEPAESGGFWIHYATYSFQLPDGQEITNSISGDGRLKSEFRYLKHPHPVDIVYLPDNPSTSCFAEDIPSGFLGILRYSSIGYYVIALAALSMGFYLLVLVVRGVRKPKLS